MKFIETDIFTIFIVKLFIFIINLYLIFINNNKIIIYIDNEISEYEKNIDFSNFTTNIKALALYLPQFHKIDENDKWWGKGFTEWTNVKKAHPLFHNHHQPRIPGDKFGYLEYYDLTDINTIKKQIHLAKSHGIYGFAIYYYWFSGKILLEKPINILLNNKDIKFPFLLIWANENWTRKWDGREKEILIKQEYKEGDPELFIEDIKKYLVDTRYIKINKKPALGIYEPSKIPKLKETIMILRGKSREINIGELFILVCLNENKIENIKNLNLFDAAYEFPPKNSNGHYIIKFKNTLIYSEIIYKNLNFTFTENFPVYRGSMLEWDNTARVNQGCIFDYYSPEQFYMNNKIIIEFTKKYYKKENRYIFINAWNEWAEGSYLEPDKKYGYASINSLSKALFNLPYINKYNYDKLLDSSNIAIHVHIYYEDLIKQIINKINNIPVNYDLYISVCSIKAKIKIEKYINKHSNASKKEIKLFPNKGRDILPLLIQLKDVIKNYKYFCHIHTKKSFHLNFGDNWRNYLYNNLLGNNAIISEILTEFENNEKLGMIFPIPYYKTLAEFGKSLYDSNIKYMNFIIKKINPKAIILPNYFDFPEGNMFWAKVNAVHQIFDINIEKKVHKEKGQLDSTLIHAIERIWVFVVKLNNFYYKRIFKHI